MSVNSIIKTALQPLIPNPDPATPTVTADIYKGTAREYITFNYTELPELHAEGKPNIIRYLIQIHWWLPLKTSITAKKKQIKNALKNAGFTYPSVVNASDGDGQHYVFECEVFDGDV